MALVNHQAADSNEKNPDYDAYKYLRNVTFVGDSTVTGQVDKDKLPSDLKYLEAEKLKTGHFTVHRLQVRDDKELQDRLNEIQLKAIKDAAAQPHAADAPPPAPAFHWDQQDEPFAGLSGTVRDDRPAAPGDRRPVLLPAAALPRPAGRRLPQQLHQKPRQALRAQPQPHHLRRRGRPAERQERAARSRRVPARPAEVPAARRRRAQGRAAGRPARHRQDAAGQGRGRRGRRAVFQHQRIGIHPDVRRRRRQPRPRHVQDGQGKRPLHPVHRRNRRRRPDARRRRRRRLRRTRADAQPDPQRDGRLHADRVGDRHGRHQPAGRAGLGPAASGPLRPAHHGRSADLAGPAGHPQGPHAQQAAGRRREPGGDGPRHDRHDGRRPAQPGQRGGPGGHARGQEPHRPPRLRAAPPTAC